jgi:hypothetical protein
MTETEKEQRRYALAISGGICEACGRPLNDGQPQGAHRIGNTKANREKYGAFVIDHILNIGYTCSLKCNGVLDISKNPAECIKLCKRIYSREALKYEGETMQKKEEVKKSCANCGRYNPKKDCSELCFDEYEKWVPMTETQRGTK